jgi:hypothetical protein
MGSSLEAVISNPFLLSKIGLEPYWAEMGLTLTSFNLFALDL